MINMNPLKNFLQNILDKIESIRKSRYYKARRRVKLVSKQLVSVQPLGAPLGKLFYISSGIHPTNNTIYGRRLKVSSNNSNNGITYGKYGNLTIQSNGHIGIGCVHPSSKLNIKGAYQNKKLINKTISNVKTTIREERLEYILSESKSK